MCIFGMRGSDGLVKPLTVVGMRVFGWKIWDGQTLVRDFVPCYRAFDFAGGLLDRVSGRFFANAGSGAFSYDITTYDAALPAAYRQLDGIIATGAQHIVTGVIADSNTTVMVEFTPHAATGQQRVFAARATVASDVTADDLFETYINDSGRCGLCCTDGPYDPPSIPPVCGRPALRCRPGNRTALTLDRTATPFT